MKVFVDTSAFYALVAEGDQNHEAAQRIHEHLKHRAATLLTTNYVVLEAVSLLQSRHGVVSAERFGDFITDRVELVWIGAAQHHESWKAWKARRHRSLSLVDCSSFVVMRDLSIQYAFVFDRQFREAGFMTVTDSDELVAERRAVYRAGRQLSSR